MPPGFTGGSRRQRRETQRGSRICLYPGGQMLYRGNWYPVTGFSKSLEVTFDGTSFSLPQARREQPGPVMEAWLKGRAKAILNKRCAELAAKMGVCYRQVKVGHAASRWGSCSSKGNLNFSYRVMLLPKALADYVVVHELCHLRQMNHSPGLLGAGEGANARLCRQKAKAWPIWETKLILCTGAPSGKNEEGMA